MIDVELGDVEA